MVKTQLVEHLIADGETLLHELDRLGFQAEAMFWIHLTEQDYWRLIIGTTIVAEEGGIAAYLRLDGIMRGLELTGITLEDISLLDPASKKFQSFRSAAAASSRLTIEPAWVRFEDAVVYRWSGESLKGNLSCTVTVDELNCFWNAERRIANLPSVLIDVNGRQVTLRFHPKHYAPEGIESLKQPFQIALHRPTARPDCKIDWMS